MVRLPREISAGAAARRALLADLLIAIAIAVVVTSLAAGLGVVAIFALPTLLVVLLWIGVERLVRRAAGARRRSGSSAPAAPTR
jgi:hypothetical protein